MEVSDAVIHQPAPASVQGTGAEIVSKGAEVATCPVDSHLRVRECGDNSMLT